MSLLLPFLFLTLPVEAQQEFNLPQIANGAGSIQTTIVAFNNSSRRAETMVAFKDDAGQPLPLDFVELGELSSLSFGLEPGETRFFRTSGPPFPSASPPSSGCLEKKAL